VYVVARQTGRTAKASVRAAWAGRSNVRDTGTALQLRAAGDIVLKAARELVAALAAHAAARRTVCVGRTHGVHAEPTTFGVKLAGLAMGCSATSSGRARVLAGLHRRGLQRGRNLLGNVPRVRAASSPALRSQRPCVQQPQRFEPRRSVQTRPHPIGPADRPDPALKHEARRYEAASATLRAVERRRAPGQVSPSGPRTIG